ncbi:tyrosine-type recombinase/integrase [Kitasatospora purpeofusca]|uniref:tyrosine-type recombinase/integrase n=1 Tax=Kitasatospora purpeofusca TaxID=67352 RepID=UPI003F4ABF7D
MSPSRGRVTVHRILATLSSTLPTAVHDGRLAHNPAKPPLLPRPASAPRRLWTEEQTARFLHFTHLTDPLYADLAELMIGSDIRKGEALALHWHDIHLPERVFFVHATLSVVDNNQMLLTTPKTKSSKAWVALSDRVVDALEDQAGPRAFGQIAPAGGYVFHRHGRPLRAALGRPTCRARRPWHQNPRPHRQLPAHQQPRTDEPTAPWPMWPGDHRTTTS